LAGTEKARSLTGEGNCSKAPTGRLLEIGGGTGAICSPAETLPFEDASFDDVVSTTAEDEVVPFVSEGTRTDPPVAPHPAAVADCSDTALRRN